MTTRLTTFQAFRVASNKLFPLAAILAALFTMCALAQYLYVAHQNRATTEAELEPLAGEIGQEIAFTNSWNLTGFRHSQFAAGSYFVFTQEGFQIEMGEFIPGLIDRVAVSDESIYEKPKTVTTPLGEKWRLWGSRVQGGFVILGILDMDEDLQDLDLADRTLRNDAAKFGRTLDEAMQVRPRDVAFKIDYAVVNDSGELKFSTSAIPLRMLAGPLLNLQATTSIIKLGGKSYFLLRRPVLNASGVAVGQIVIPKDVTTGERAVHSLSLFNLGIGGLCWLLVLVLVAANGIASEIEKHRLEISLEEALRQGEGQTIEFKEGISMENLPPAISAFANTNAGVIFVGVRDNREVCGVMAANPQEEERVKQKIRDVLQNRVDPLIIPNLKYYESAGKKVLRVSIPRGDRPPYLGNGVVYRRVLAAVVPARADDIRKMR